MVMDAQTMKPPRIVIVGAGFGGAYCAQALEKALKPQEAELFLLDRRNYFAFTPLLVEAGTGSLQPRHAVISIRSFLKRSRFLMAEVIGVSPERNEIRFHIPGDELVQSLAYDQLVLALGSVTRVPPIPGLAEHGFGMKSLSDAVRLRDRAIRLLEQADALMDEALRRACLHFIVVGANFTGVEVAGEFLVYLQQASRRYPRVKLEECQVTLVEIGERVLPALDADLSRYAQDQLAAQGVRILLEQSVKEIRATEVVLRDDSILPSRTVIWCAGIAAPPAIWGSALPVDERGYLLCEPDTRVKGQDRIWAIGDCAVNVNAHGKSFPATAQHAVKEGEQLARNLARSLRGKATLPMNYRDRGNLVALGHHRGVAKVFGFKLSGFWAWFLWRTVYLAKMPGWVRRLRVTLDWSLDLLFPKDYVELGWDARAHEPVRDQGTNSRFKSE